MAEASTHGHLSVRQLAGIDFMKIDELGVPEPSTADLDHYKNCSGCADRGLELSGVLHVAITHEQQRLVVTKLERSTLLELVRQVLQKFEANEGGLIA